MGTLAETTLCCFFVAYASTGMNPWLYSALYNESYLLGEFLISAILTHLLVRRGVHRSPGQPISGSTWR
jgi:thiamine transporter ThiT